MNNHEVGDGIMTSETKVLERICFFNLSTWAVFGINLENFAAFNEIRVFIILIYISSLTQTNFFLEMNTTSAKNYKDIDSYRGLCRNHRHTCRRLTDEIMSMKDLLRIAGRILYTI